MLDHRRQGCERPRYLTPSSASAKHYWLMRRELHCTPVPALPKTLKWVELSGENAINVHELLVLGEDDGGGHVADFDSWWRSFQEDGECAPELCLIIEDQQGIVAVAQCWTSAFIRYLAVHPRARRQGFGRVLLQQAFALFARRDEAWLDLNVMENNLPARRLYEQSGMRYVRRAELVRA